MSSRNALPSRTLIATACSLMLALNAAAQSSVSTTTETPQLATIQVSSDWLGSGL